MRRGLPSTPVGARTYKWFPLLLMVLSLWDLKTEIILLADQFTFTGLNYALRHHMLAVVVLVAFPSLGVVIDRFQGVILVRLCFSGPKLLPE